MNKTMDDVKKFWEENPLFYDESNFEIGSKSFYVEKIFLNFFPARTLLFKIPQFLYKNMNFMIHLNLRKNN